MVVVLVSVPLNINDWGICGSAGGIMNGRYYLVLAVEALVVGYVGIMESGMALLDINNWGIGGGGVGWWSVDDDVMSVMVDETWL